MGWIKVMALVGAVGGVHLVSGYAVGSRLLWESNCDYLDRRCSIATTSGSNLQGAMICGWGGLLTLGGRNAAQCGAILDSLDGK